jgi:dipeptidyl-peptidase-4
MKKLILIWILISLPVLAKSPKRLSFDDVLVRPPFKYASLGRPVWLPGENSYLIRGRGEDRKSLFIVDVVNGDTTKYLDSSAFIYNGKMLRVLSFRLDPAGKQLLIQTNRKRIWRHSYYGTYYLLNMETGKLIPVTEDNQNLRNVKFSPDSRWLAYVREDNNLYAFNIQRQHEKKLTRSGSDVILNGHFGWVYEEEFGSYDAYRWSPDSKSIAFWEEDQSEVPEYPLVDLMKLYPTIQKIRYPKAGEPNPSMRIGIVKVKTGGLKWLRLGPDDDVYYPWMEWQSPSQLTVMKMNRPQNHWIFLNVNPKTGRYTEGLDEADTHGWVDLNRSYHFLEDGRILWISERSGFNHLWIHNPNGSEGKAITEGPWEVTSIVSIDEGREVVYFQANRESVFGNNFYRVKFDGSDLQLLTPEEGYHSVSMTPGKDYFIDSYSSVRQPRRILLRNLDGDIVRVLGETDLAQFQEYDWSFPQFVHFKDADGKYTLDGILTLPPDYKQGKRYPVIVYGYGMPGTQIVWNRWGSSWSQFLAQNGYIIFSMDSRGMSGRGEAFKNLSYHNMARFLAPDQVAGVEYLIQAGYADPDRIGAWGWSGGGYFTGLMLTKNTDYFQVGVAVAPVMDFRLYDTIYTERTMGLPSENKDGYDSTSVFTYVNQFKGKLLVLHGTGDDNVHYQNTMQLVEEFIKADKPLDMFLYPNRNHGMGGGKGNARRHLFEKMFSYFQEHL